MFYVLRHGRLTEEGLEHLAHYVIRAPISQERMIYIAASETPGGIAKVIYTGKNSRVQEQFTALDWLVRLVSKLLPHISRFFRSHVFESAFHQAAFSAFGSSRSGTYRLPPRFLPWPPYRETTDNQ